MGGGGRLELFPLYRLRRGASHDAARCFVLRALVALARTVAIRQILKALLKDEVSTLSVCVLSSAEAGRLEHWKIWPRCREHLHCSRRVANAGAEAGLYRYLNGPDGTPVSMVTAALEPARWSPQQAHNLDGSVIIGFKVWGNAPSM